MSRALKENMPIIESLINNAGYDYLLIRTFDDETLIEIRENFFHEININDFLFEAISHLDINVFKKLIKLGYDINIKDKMGYSLLAQASRIAGGEFLNILIENGVDLNIDSSFNDMSPLMAACASDKSECARILIENGVDINYQSDTGDTALIWSVIHESPKCMKLLIDHGADADIKNNFGQKASDYFEEDNYVKNLII